MGCGKCVDVCPEGIFEIRDLDGRKVSTSIGEENCFLCRACQIKCPENAIEIAPTELLKVDPPPEYPPEEGRYLRGNDLSPVAVVAILDTSDFKIPLELTGIVQAAVESGAALAGTLQTENIGIEKVIVNVVANPNIRYIVLCWRESQGHLTANALVSLLENGVKNDNRRTIIGARARTPYLPNILMESIDRFRKQITLVNLISEEDPRRGMDVEPVKQAVWACIQEEPTEFLDYKLFDPGAWPEPPICRRIVTRIAEPWRPELNDKQREIVEKILSTARNVQKRTGIEGVEYRIKRSQEQKKFLELLGIKSKKKQEI